MRKVFKGVQRERLPLGERNVLWGFPEVPLSYARLILCSYYIMQMAERNRAEVVSAAMGQLRHGVTVTQSNDIASGTEIKI